LNGHGDCQRKLLALMFSTGFQSGSFKKSRCCLMAVIRKGVAQPGSPRYRARPLHRQDDCRRASRPNLGRIETRRGQHVSLHSSGPFGGDLVGRTVAASLCQGVIDNAEPQISWINGDFLCELDADSRICRSPLHRICRATGCASRAASPVNLNTAQPTRPVFVDAQQ
jgi:hypothetical protein